MLAGDHWEMSCPSRVPRRLHPAPPRPACSPPRPPARRPLPILPWSSAGRQGDERRCHYKPNKSRSEIDDKNRGINCAFN